MGSCTSPVSGKGGILSLGKLFAFKGLARVAFFCGELAFWV